MAEATTVIDPAAAGQGESLHVSTFRRVVQWPFSE